MSIEDDAVLLRAAEAIRIAKIEFYAARTDRNRQGDLYEAAVDRLAKAHRELDEAMRALSKAAGGEIEP